MELILFGVALPWVFVALGGWLGYQLVRQNGRMLLRLEALEQRLAPVQPAPAPAAEPPAPAGPPLGSAAPAFELPDLGGERKPLSAFRGKRLLLIFFNPRCGFCRQMADDLAAIPIDGDGPVPLVVTTGDLQVNREFFEAHGIRCPVLVQEQMEVASRYQCQGTPMGYLIDAEGKIDSPLAVGADALLALTEPLATGSEDGQARPAHKGNRDLSASKIERDGLPAGTPAPDFALPTLDGEELALSQYRGREVVLVFSDPKCGPCNQIAPDLEQFHRRTGAAQVVMVSRGEIEANRAKAEGLGLTFPIGVQKQWEVSRAYAMFATPIAYRIDAAGIIAEEVAVGGEPIRALLARIAVQTNGKQPMARRDRRAVARR
jgi:peroxiredoxin